MSLHEPQDALPDLTFWLAVYVLVLWGWAKITGRAL